MVNPQQATKLRWTLVRVRCHAEPAVQHQCSSHHQPVTRLKNVKADNLAGETRVANKKWQSIMRGLCLNFLSTHHSSFREHAGNDFSKINCEGETPSLISRVELARS
jgi:hypothetical protein